MQIGLRWRDTEAPHSSVPHALQTALTSALQVASDQPGWWTLTWLEGRPWCTHDSGTRVTLLSDGTARILPAHESTTYDGAYAEEDDDDWLEG